jgi:hypothetical protein
MQSVRGLGWWIAGLIFLATPIDFLNRLTVTEPGPVFTALFTPGGRAIDQPRPAHRIRKHLVRNTWFEDDWFGDDWRSHA